MSKNLESVVKLIYRTSYADRKKNCITLNDWILFSYKFFCREYWITHITENKPIVTSMQIKLYNNLESLNWKISDKSQKDKMESLIQAQNPTGKQAYQNSHQKIHFLSVITDHISLKTCTSIPMET